MTLSRTARILIAILLLAAAVFFWVNFFSQEPPTPPATLSDTPSPTPPTVAPAEDGTAPATGADASPAATADGTAAQPSGDGTPTVVVPNAPNVATRDLQVAELPFLVTEPPTPAATEGAAAAAGGGASRPQGAQRVSVNPFSPIVVQAPAAQAPVASAPSAPPASSPAVITETASASGSGGASAGAAPATPVRAPAPRPLTPPSPQTATLPRQLPSGTLPVAPDILRSSRTQPVANAPADLGRTVAVREPGTEPLPSGTLGTAAGGEVRPTSSVPQVLGPRAPQAEAQNGSQAAGEGTAPLQAGTDRLSRYLRDNNVRFTGTVLGPVSVGVFRSALYRVPVVLSLGQKLPETNIVLTDIRGHEAQFKLDETTQTLSLDLRR